MSHKDTDSLLEDLGTFLGAVEEKDLSESKVAELPVAEQEQKGTESYNSGDIEDKAFSDMVVQEEVVVDVSLDETEVLKLEVSELDAHLAADETKTKEVKDICEKATASIDEKLRSGELDPAVLAAVVEFAAERLGKESVLEGKKKKPSGKGFG